MNRRGFMGSILALGLAPAIVRASSLMPVIARIPDSLILYGDGIHDDTKAMQAFLDGQRVLNADGTVRGSGIRSETFLLSGPLLIRDSPGCRSVCDSVFRWEGEPYSGPAYCAQSGFIFIL